MSETLWVFDIAVNKFSFVVFLCVLLQTKSSYGGCFITRHISTFLYKKEIKKRKRLPCSIFVRIGQRFAHILSFHFKPVSIFYCSCHEIYLSHRRSLAYFFYSNTDKFSPYIEANLWSCLFFNTEGSCVWYVLNMLHRLWIHFVN